jgi:hypothetical protein
LCLNGVPAMKNALMKNWGLRAVIVASVILAMPVTAFCALQDSDQQQEDSGIISGDIEDLHLKADTEAREVNETIKAEIQQAEAIKRTRYQEELGYIPKGNLLSDEERAAFEKQRLEKIRAIRSEINYDVNELKQIYLSPQAPPQPVEEPYKRHAPDGDCHRHRIILKKSRRTD